VVAKAYFESVVVEGKTFALDHLEPFTFNVDSERAKKTLRIHVTFSSHCFTRSHEPENDAPGVPIFPDHMGRPRVFCRTRYRLSLALPELIKGLGGPRVKVMETAAQRNWAYSIRVEDPAGPYHVFFEVRRAGKEHRDREDLRLVVESAYHQDSGQPPPKLRGVMAFVLLCGKVYLGEPASTRR